MDRCLKTNERIENLQESIPHFAACAEIVSLRRTLTFLGVLGLSALLFVGCQSPKTGKLPLAQGPTELTVGDVVESPFQLRRNSINHRRSGPMGRLVSRWSGKFTPPAKRPLLCRTS